MNLANLTSNKLGVILFPLYHTFSPLSQILASRQSHLSSTPFKSQKQRQSITRDLLRVRLELSFCWAHHLSCCATLLCDHILKGKQKTSLSLFCTNSKGQTHVSTLRNLFYSTKTCFYCKKNHGTISTTSLLSLNLCLDQVKKTQTPNATFLPHSRRKH